MLKLLTDLARNRVPGQVVIQYTDRCNAKCPQCGMRVTEKFDRSKLSVDDGKRILDAAAARGIPAVSFTGGEPLLYLDEVAELMRHAGRLGIPYIRTGTNGFLFRDGEPGEFRARVTKVAETLASTPVRNLWISIDSADDGCHQEMRGMPGLSSGVEKALPILHEHGIYPTANLGINRNTGGEATRSLRLDSLDDAAAAEQFMEAYREAFRAFLCKVIGMGFTVVNTCYPMSVGDQEESGELSAAYAATSQEDVIHYNPAEKALVFKALLETIPEFRGQTRVFSPRSTLYALHRHYAGEEKLAYSCRGGSDWFFIDSQDGNTYPCGYRGQDNLGKFWELNGGLDPKDECFRCDWQCFRDPAELFGPALDALRRPWRAFARFFGNREHFRIWLTDLRYYRACDLFDGRKPPNLLRLKRFAK